MCQICYTMIWCIKAKSPHACLLLVFYCYVFVPNRNPDNSILLSIKREKKVGVFIITCRALVRTLLKLLPFWLSIFFFFFWSCGMQDLSSPTRDWTQAPGNESMESSPLDRQGIPLTRVNENQILCLQFYLSGKRKNFLHNSFRLLSFTPCFSYTPHTVRALGTAHCRARFSCDVTPCHALLCHPLCALQQISHHRGW